jgi:uncharacterized YceG family protein
LSRGNRSQPAQERTAEERERDRQERERRRASRSASDPPPQPPPIASEQSPASAPPPASDVPLPSDVPQPSDVRQPSDVPPSDVHLPSDVQPRSGQAPADVQAPFQSAAHEASPVAHLLGAARDERTPHGAAGESMGWQGRSGGAAGGRSHRLLRSRRGGDDRGRARHRGAASGRRLTRARVAALLALAAAVALVWFLLSLFQPFAGAGHGRVIVVIPKGSSSSKIGSILARDGVVSSGFFFEVRALLTGKRSSLHSGRFELKRDMSYSAAIDALSKPPPRTIAVKVVIPEGYTRRQIAELVREDALSGDYLAASKRSRLLDPASYGAPRGTADLEGFLFPATYDLIAGAPVARLVGEQLSAFRVRFSAANVRRAHALHVTPYQLLTVASMIEREAQTAHDRPRIAAVIYNRLREGVPLGIDATIYYAVELQKGIATYTGELTEAQLKIDSPYNTRTHKGLPPTPISNPGQASIEAAAHPSGVPYLYYVAGADGCGEQVFSKTYAEFQRNVAAYDAAVKKNGGRPPTCKK